MLLLALSPLLSPWKGLAQVPQVVPGENRKRGYNHNHHTRSSQPNHSAWAISARTSLGQLNIADIWEKKCLLLNAMSVGVVCYSGVIMAMGNWYIAHNRSSVKSILLFPFSLPPQHPKPSCPSGHHSRPGILWVSPQDSLAYYPTTTLYNSSLILIICSPRWTYSHFIKEETDSERLS